MLKRGIEVLVGTALVIAMLAVLPAVAEAQSRATTQDARGTSRGDADAAPARVVVVRPGDSLWLISSERLGPNATPRQIASEAQRIYALNQNQIGPNPNLIFAGQKLLLPPVGEPSTAEPPPRVTPVREATEPAKSSPMGRDVKSETEEASSTTVGEAGSQAGRAHDSVAEPVALPDMPTNEVTPKVSSPSATEAPSLVESFGRTAQSLLSYATSAIVGLFPQDDLLTRKLFGWGSIVLTVLITALLAWKLPLKRNVGAFEVWGIPNGYVGGYTPRVKATDRYQDTPGLVLAAPIAEPDPGSFGGETPAVENDLDNAGMLVAARKRRERVLRKRELGSRPVPRAGLATGAHNPQISRRLRRARNSASLVDPTRATMTGAKKAPAGVPEPTLQAGPSLGRRREDAEPGRKRALLVAKHALFRESLATVLEWREGFKVVQAESLAEAHLVLGTSDAELDLAVVDLELPSGDGVRLIREMHQTWPHIPILALTTSRDTERAARAKEAGAGQVLSTTANSEELFEEVRRLGNG